MMRTWTDEQFIAAVNGASNYQQVFIRLGLGHKGGNTKTVRRHIERLRLHTKHFKHTPGTKPKANSEVFSARSTYYGGALRRRYVRLSPPTSCARCGIGRWNDDPISLEMDHVNGNPSDNRLENLRWLCPNCHSQTPTYRNRKR